MNKHASLHSYMSLMRFGLKSVFAIRGEKVCIMDFNERNFFEADGNNALGRRKNDNFEFSYLEKFFSLNKLWWDDKSLKLELNPLFSRKSQVKLSLSPKLNGTNEDHRVENGGLYRIGYVKENWRVTK
jgi:hypothetical protein